MVQLEAKHVGECTSMIQNNRYLHLPDKCSLLVVNEQLITNTQNMQHFKKYIKFSTLQSEKAITKKIKDYDYIKYLT